MFLNYLPILLRIVSIPPVPLPLEVMAYLRLEKLVRSKVSTSILGPNLPRSLKTIFLLVSDCSTVFTGPLPISSCCFTRVYPSVIPLCYTSIGLNLFLLNQG